MKKKRKKKKKKEKEEKAKDEEENYIHLHLHLHFIQSSSFFPSNTSLSFFFGTLSGAIHRHILFRDHSDSALLREPGDVHCPLDKASLLRTTSLFPFLPSNLFRVHICLLSTVLLRASFRPPVMQLGAADHSYAY